MIKATKPQIMRDLRAMKEEQVEAKKKENNKKVSELKKSLIAKHRPDIEGLVKELKPFIIKAGELALVLKDDSNINMRYYGDTSFISSFTSVERVESYIYDRAGWYQGQTQVLEDALRKELNVLANEWDNLLLNCSLMTAQQLRQYIVDNKIELPCMSDKPEEVKTLIVPNVDLDLLFEGERNAE